jgi:hypothetical protein
MTLYNVAHKVAVFVWTAYCVLFLYGYLHILVTQENYFSIAFTDYENRLFAVDEGHKLQVSENKATRKVFGTKLYARWNVWHFCCYTERCSCLGLCESEYSLRYWRFCTRTVLKEPSKVGPRKKKIPPPRFSRVASPMFISGIKL